MTDRAEKIARGICLAIYSDRKGFTVPPREQIDTVEGLIASALRASEERARKAEALNDKIVPAWKTDLAFRLAAEARVKELEAALTPSADTKAAYIAEFSFTRTFSGPDPDDEDGEHVEQTETIVVPWDTIKEIMKAILARAALGASPGKTPPA